MAQVSCGVVTGSDAWMERKICRDDMGAGPADAWG